MLRQHVPVQVVEALAQLLALVRPHQVHEGSLHLRASARQSAMRSLLRQATPGLYHVLEPGCILGIVSIHLWVHVC